MRRAAGRSAIVDVHSHLYPRWYLDRLAERSEPPRVVRAPDGDRLLLFPTEQSAGGSGGRPIGPDFWDVGHKLAFMDHFGIERTILSLGNPWLDVFGRSDGLVATRRVNEEFGRMGAETGGRVVGLGALPPALEDAAGVTEELAAAGLPGVVIGTRPCGLRIDDPALAPLWERLEAHRLVVLIHPHYGLGIEEMEGLGHAGPVALAFPFETTLAAVRLLFAGIPARHPGLRLLLSHAGGALPFLTGRIDAAWRSDAPVRARLDHEPGRDLARLWLDAVLFDAAAVRAAGDRVDPSHLAFGTDHPFSIADPERTLAALRDVFSGDALAAVLGGSAEGLFGGRGNVPSGGDERRS